MPVSQSGAFVSGTKVMADIDAAKRFNQNGKNYNSDNERRWNGGGPGRGSYQNQGRGYP